MAVIFDRSSAQIKPDFHRAQPDCFLSDPQRVHFHLTEGFDSTKICRRGHRPALAAQGSIRISARSAELSGWDFGFIQIARSNSMSSYYVGRTRKEGSLSIQAHLPPALQNPMLLDGGSALDPWIRFGGGAAGPIIEPTRMADDMSDHPSSCAEKIRRNGLTKCENLLFHVIAEDEFWTTLCARDPSGKFQQFAHFRWVVRWDQKFLWRGKSIMKGPSASIINHDAVVLGPPPDPAVQALLNSPADPVANDKFNDAARNFPRVSPNYTEGTDWFHNVPPDFFSL